MLSITQITDILSQFGELRSQTISNWHGEIALPKQIEDFYLEVGPVDLKIDSIGNPYHIPSLSRLWEFQAGYRWNGITGEPSNGWNDNWVVVADEGADPFIFDRHNGEILFALHGQGTWEPERVFPDIYTMAACLGILGSTAAAAGEELFDGDSLNSKYLENIIARFKEILGQEFKATQILETLGWV